MSPPNRKVISRSLHVKRTLARSSRTKALDEKDPLDGLRSDIRSKLRDAGLLGSIAALDHGAIVGLQALLGPQCAWAGPEWCCVARILASHIDRLIAHDVKMEAAFEERSFVTLFRNRNRSHEDHLRYL